jgi:hypothetical protein
MQSNRKILHVLLLGVSAISCVSIHAQTPTPPTYTDAGKSVVIP